MLRRAATRAVLALLLLGAAAAGRAEDAFAGCRAEAGVAPDNRYATALCFLHAASRSGDWNAAAAALRDHVQRYPDIVWYRLVLGYVLASTGDPGAVAQFLDAAGRFEATGEALGELLARANLRIRYFENGAMAEAHEQFRRIADIGARAQDTETRVRARVVQGRHLIDTRGDLNAAYRALYEAQQMPHADVPYFLQREILNDLGQLQVAFGAYPEALDYFAAYTELAEQHDDAYGEALARTNRANTLLELYRISPASVPFADLLAAAERALQQAEAGQDLSVELFSLRVLAETVAASDPARALALTRRCVERAQGAERFWQQSQCLWLEAFALVGQAPARAREKIDAAVAAMARATQSDQAQAAFAWRYFMRVHWQSANREDAQERALRALDGIEALRATQAAGHARNSVFSAWTPDYRWLIGGLLAAAADARGTAHYESLLAQALTVGERMRARTLLESLAATPASTPDRTALDGRIAELNRRLFDASPARAAELQLELAALERSDTEQRYADLVRPGAVQLDALQAQLRDDQALLVLQLAHGVNRLEQQQVGSWLIAITRDAVALHPAPDVGFLLRAQRAFAGDNPKLARRFAHTLYQRLFHDALAALPARVTDLILVPDAPLNSLAFAALSTERDYRPLAQRVAVSVVPSLSTWQRLRAAPGAGPAARALVLAEPDLSSYGALGSTLKVWQNAEPTSLTALPAARSEAASVTRALPGSVAWLGERSSEAALKNAEHRQFGVLHFAAHAMIDDANSDRSALLLAPGSADEDGLLQVREISRLTLQGQLVVLASCQSAVGRDLRGEGVISLTRAFLAAGAGAVVGTLWPVQDDLAAELVQRFYAALARGDAAAEALRAAQQQMFADGHPHRFWSAFVLHGDGRWRLGASVGAQPTTGGR